MAENLSETDFDPGTTITRSSLRVDGLGADDVPSSQSRSRDIKPSFGKASDYGAKLETCSRVS